jgi:hypothetical protein
MSCEARRDLLTLESGVASRSNTLMSIHSVGIRIIDSRNNGEKLYSV